MSGLLDGVRVIEVALLAPDALGMHLADLIRALHDDTLGQVAPRDTFEDLHGLAQGPRRHPRDPQAEQQGCRAQSGGPPAGRNPMHEDSSRGMSLPLVV